MDSSLPTLLNDDISNFIMSSPILIFEAEKTFQPKQLSNDKNGGSNKSLMCTFVYLIWVVKQEHRKKSLVRPNCE